MANDRSIGCALGLLLVAVVVTGNNFRADPHLVSVYQGVVSMAIAPVVVFVLGRRRRRTGQSSEAVRLLSVRVGLIAGGVFAAGLGAYTAYWLPHVPLMVFAVATAFASTFILCCLAGMAAGQQRTAAI